MVHINLFFNLIKKGGIFWENQAGMEHMGTPKKKEPKNVATNLLC